MKILVLSCNTGQGHNSAGYAIKEALEARGVLCEMADALSFARREYTSALISEGYVKIVSKAPIVFGGMYKASDIISSSKGRSPVYFANALSAKRLGRFIDTGGYHGVVMPHVFPAETLTRLKRRGKTDVRTYAVATDYTCSPFWEETTPDYFFIPHVGLAEEFNEKGIPLGKLVPSGIPVSPKYMTTVPKADARRQLGVPENATVFLIMTGSMGFGDISGVTAEILRLAPGTEDSPVRVMIMTGRSEKLKRRLAEDFEGDERVMSIPFTSQVPLYMDACDVLLTKPGGLTTTEAAVKGVPFIHTKPIPGCETKNARFFENHGMSMFVKRFSDTPEVAVKLAYDKEAREAMVDRQRTMMPRDAAGAIARFIIDDVDTHRRKR